MIAFLIDADNLSSPASLEEACMRLEAELGSLAVRRAYGSPENLRSLSEVFRRRSIRPYPNLALSKNTTDIALAVDAMELVCRVPAPTVMAIGSGDADFVPLVVRLREHGVRVVCVSERTTLTSDAKTAFDRVILVGEEGASGLPESTTHQEPVGSEPAVEPLASRPATPAKAVAPKPVVNQATPTKTEAAPAVSLKRILAAAPALEAGEWQHMSEIVNALRDHKLLSKSANSPKFFAKYPGRFELHPLEKPNRVRYIAIAR